MAVVATKIAELVEVEDAWNQRRQAFPALDSLKA